MTEDLAIFGGYAETSLESWSRTKPLHLNIVFDEPLIDEPFGVRQPQLPLSYATSHRERQSLPVAYKSGSCGYRTPKRE